eukprot:gb/GECG01002405.1/.p1 GENE.gb/GECG01002405.1/~~gb/GECG01002405.1/.p1  ORF type:complete len:276 (+),score=50.04 gb/GECG01002405.1/:1-828(+)
MNNELNLETLLLSRTCFAGVFLGTTALLGYSYWHNASSIKHLSKKPPSPAISKEDLLELMKALQTKCKEASSSIKEAVGAAKDKEEKRKLVELAPKALKDEVEKIQDEQIKKHSLTQDQVEEAFAYYTHENIMGGQDVHDAALQVKQAIGPFYYTREELLDAFDMIQSSEVQEQVQEYAIEKGSEAAQRMMQQGVHPMQMQQQFGQELGRICQDRMNREMRARYGVDIQSLGMHCMSNFPGDEAFSEKLQGIENSMMELVNGVAQKVLMSAGMGM